MHSAVRCTRLEAELTRMAGLKAEEVQLKQSALGSLNQRDEELAECYAELHQSKESCVQLKNQVSVWSEWLE